MMRPNKIVLGSLMLTCLLMASCAEYIAFELLVAASNAKGDKTSSSSGTASSNSSSSASCSTDTSLCSDAGLCQQATLNNSWERRPKYLAHVKEAKARGLKCGVNSARLVCPGNVTQCSEEIVCVGAKTRRYLEKKLALKWSKHNVYKEYVVEAKKRNLLCIGY